MKIFMFEDVNESHRPNNWKEFQSIIKTYDLACQCQVHTYMILVCSKNIVRRTILKLCLILCGMDWKLRKDKVHIVPKFFCSTINSERHVESNELYFDS